MEKRIIFFVDNSTDRTKGLYRCFGQREDLINQFCQTYLFSSDPNDTTRLQPIINDTNQCLFISEKDVKAYSLAEGKQGPLDNWRILLIHDSVTMANAAEFFSNDTYIVYHRKPDDAETFLRANPSTFYRCIKSVHELSGKYPLIYKITEIFKNESPPFDNSEFEKVFEEILSSLFNTKLDSILELLHLLLVGKKPTNENKIIGKLINEGIDLSQNTLYEKVANIPMNNIDSFKTFCVDILKDI
jgi:hypothetical protein